MWNDYRPEHTPAKAQSDLEIAGGTALQMLKLLMIGSIPVVIAIILGF